jgi:DNA-binding MarR family transcriptional regulator
LRIYEKDYKNAQKALKKVTTLGEDILEESLSVEWKKKRLPEQVIKQGMLTESEYKLAHLCDGSKDVHEIAEEMGITTDRTQLIIEKLDRLGLIKLIKL